jgi:hypothetical protein
MSHGRIGEFAGLELSTGDKPGEVKGTGTDIEAGENEGRVVGHPDSRVKSPWPQPREIGSVSLMNTGFGLPKEVRPKILFDVSSEGGGATFL